MQGQHGQWTQRRTWAPVPPASSQPTPTCLYMTTIKSYLQKQKPGLPEKDNLALADRTPASCKLREQQSDKPNTGNNIKFPALGFAWLLLLRGNLQLGSHFPLSDIKSTCHPKGTYQMSLEPSSKTPALGSGMLTLCSIQMSPQTPSPAPGHSRCSNVSMWNE